MLRGFFRKQGGFNRSLLEAVSALAENNEALNVRVQELRATAETQDRQLLELVALGRSEADWRKAVQVLLAESHAQLERHGEQLRDQADRAEAQVRTLAEFLSVKDHLGDLQGQTDRAGEHLRNLQTISERGAQDLRNLREMLVHIEARQVNDAIFTKGELSEQSALVHRLLASGTPGEKRIGTGPSDEMAELDAHRLDAFYLSFENQFRGTRAEVKERIRFYLPLVKKAEAGGPGRRIVDVGCGRGEWLELLRENGLDAMGLDLNQAMVAQCEERNLPVTQGDAVAYLRSLPDNSQGAVTGFHIIEHLPLETLVDLFAEARRVLRPGGLVIFESPNCKNLVVGACNFNVDPTHRNPVFPETAEFMLDAQGFEKIQIEYLSPVETSHIPGSDEVAPALRALLYGPQDFAVIGRKPMSP